MIPAQLTLDLPQGSTFDETLIFYVADSTPLDLTNYTARMTIRRDHDGPVIIALTSGVAAPPDADGITLGGTAGTVRIYIRDETTADMTERQWVRTTTAGVVTYTGRWDLELINAAGEAFREVEGVIRFSREVTS